MELGLTAMMRRYHLDGLMVFFDFSGEVRVVAGLQMRKRHKDNSDTSVNKGNWTRLSLDARSCDLT